MRALFMLRSVEVFIPHTVLCCRTELEEMVCGMVTIDVEMLRSSAIYEGCTATDRHVG
jgi:hypothetical protein